MTDSKKTPSGKNTAYKIEAAARRAKIASKATPVANEVKPSQGRIRTTLAGKPMRLPAPVFGPTSIEIPEFSLVRKRKQD